MPVQRVRLDQVLGPTCRNVLQITKRVLVQWPLTFAEVLLHASVHMVAFLLDPQRFRFFEKKIDQFDLILRFSVNSEATNESGVIC